MKFSKDLLELRDKEAKLVRMKRYEEAEKVKMKADLLEEFERNKLEAEVSMSKLVTINIHRTSASVEYFKLRIVFKHFLQKNYQIRMSMPILNEYLAIRKGKVFYELICVKFVKILNLKFPSELVLLQDQTVSCFNTCA